jgi:ribonuclease HI
MTAVPPPPAASRDAARTVVYTDGACSGNPGPGGWAWIVPDGPFRAGHAEHTTNQRMELEAALEAVRGLPHPLEVASDSTYVVNCFRDGWWKGWLKRNWQTSANKPVANRDLWEPLIEAVRAGDVTFRWVKGHAGDRWNDYADRLAVEAAFTQTPRSGDGTPAHVGGPDSSGPGRVASSSAPTDRAEAKQADPTGREAPVGHRLVVGGDRDLVASRALLTHLAEVIDAKATMHDDLVVLSGLRMGGESAGAEAARRAGVPYVAVLPYPDPAERWPVAARETFEDLVADAAEVIELQKKTPTDAASARGAIGRRDAWFRRNAHEALVVWDEVTSGETARFVKALRDALGDEVWLVDPGPFT